MALSNNYLLKEYPMIDARDSLESKFLNAYDESQVLGVVDRILSGANLSPNVLLGEGVHFKTYLIPAAGLDLVVKISKDEFSQRRDHSLRSWRHAIGELHRVKAPLIPPLRHISYHTHDVLVMPRGRPVSEKVDDMALAGARDATLLALERHQLKLDDYWQILVCDNAAFICDWSDLYSMSI